MVKCGVFRVDVSGGQAIGTVSLTRKLLQRRPVGQCRKTETGRVVKDLGCYANQTTQKIKTLRRGCVLMIINNITQ